MKTVTFRRYDPKIGITVPVEIALPDHVTVTGDEDHFALAHHDARMILCGLRQADSECRWSIVRIDIS